MTSLRRRRHRRPAATVGLEPTRPAAEFLRELGCESGTVSQIMFAFDESVDSEDSFVLAQELARVGCASIDLIGFSGPRPVTVGLCLAAGVAVPVRVEEEGQFAVDAKMRDLVLGSDQDVRVGRRVTSLPRSAMFRFAAQHGYDLVIDPRSQVAHRLEDDGRGEGLGPPATRGRAR